jgi:protein-S-isoprenylcysteine O-methyltransferase Ste14
MSAHSGSAVLPMTIILYLFSASFLLAVAFIVFRIVVRHQYKSRGSLTPLAGFLELLVWVMFVCFPYIYNPPDWWVPWTAEVAVDPALRIIGLALTTVGIAVAVVGMATLGLPGTFGRKTGALARTGLYRVSRNPQVVAAGLMVVGIVMLWPTWYALGWLLLLGAIGHMMVLTEEEHLRSVFGGQYDQYCADVPRYLRAFPRRESSHRRTMREGKESHEQ